MINRREFLGSSLAGSAVALTGPAENNGGAHSLRQGEAVFLGRPLDFWAAEFLRNGQGFDWACDALPAFGAEAIPRIVKVVNSPDRRLREHYFPSIVTKIAEASPQVVDYLLQASRANHLVGDIGLRHLVDSDPRVLDYYTRAVTGSPCPKRRAFAIAAVEDSDGAAEFAQCPGVSDVIVAMITDSVRDLKAGRFPDRRLDKDCDFIAKLARSESDKVDLCEAVLSLPVSGRHGPPCFIYTTLNQLAEIASPRAIERLFEAAADQTVGYRAAAVWALANMEPPPVSRALSLAQPGHGWLSVAAFQVLADIHDLSDAVLQRCHDLLDELFDGSRALEAIPDRSAPHACIAAAVLLTRHGWLTDLVRRVLRFALEHGDSDYRRMAIDAIPHVPRQDRFLDDAIPRLLEDTHEEIRERAMGRVIHARLDCPAIRARILRLAERQLEVDFGHERFIGIALEMLRCREAVPIIVKSLRDECPERRERAVCLLGWMGPLAGSAVPALVDYWDTCDPERRHMILDALCDIGPTRLAVPLVEAGLDDDSGNLFCAAARCAEEIWKQYPSQILPRLLAALSMRDQSSQQAAALVLSRCGNQWVNKAAQLIVCPNPVARIGGVEAVGWCQPPVPQAALEAMELALKDNDLAVKLTALASLQWRGKDWRPLEPAVRAMCDDPRDSVRYHACEVVRVWNDA